MNKTFQMFYLLTLSPWPSLLGVVSLCFFSSLLFWFKLHACYQFLIATLCLVVISFFWWRDLVRESTYQGNHTMSVQQNLLLGMIIFIFTEVIFFTGFFWTFFHASICPTSDLGSFWPPFGLFPLNPFQVPLLNTLVLVSSGVTVTSSHYSLLINDASAINTLFYTIFLGLYFTFLQGFEYFNSSYSLADSVYGTTFFVATGFHGLHVIVGSIFLMFAFFRLLMKQMTENHHLNYELAIWYWHFVDVVWLFLFSFIYWWSF